MNEEKKTGAEELCAIFSDMGCTKEEADTIIDILFKATQRKMMSEAWNNALKKEEEEKPFKPYECSFNELAGKTLTDIDVIRDEPGADDEIIFHCSDGTAFRMYHERDCCESVTIEDICGNIQLLVGKPISFAREATNSGDTEDDDSFTYTFYHIANLNTYVTIRWYGESNGYYSESVTFERIK